MNKVEYLERYAQGWASGDIAMITEALAEDYYLDDPDAGRISREALADYLAAAKEQVAALRGGVETSVFYEFSDAMAQEDRGILTAWCWWSIPGTSLQGSGLTKVGDNGVLSERIAYYAATSQ